MLQSDLPFPVRRGKVRDVYDLGDTLLIVATDRISAFDCIMPNGIPDKGRLLTQLSNFWFRKFAGRIENHLVETDVDRFPAPLRAFAAQLKDRSIVVTKTEVIPVECVARGYLAGSGWKEYRASGTVCGVALPAGLQQCDKLPEPIFTPATKEETGHDINISFERMVEIVGSEIAHDLRQRSIDVYRRAAEYARTRGIIIADTKFEWGAAEHEIILIDEVLTPDSSRFWPAVEYAPGRPQASFDKQFVRDWLETTGWDKNSPPPALPDNIIARTREKYLEAFSILTGQSNAIHS